MKSPDEFRKGSHELGRALSSPITVELEVTSRCNNLCQFCYNVWDKNHKSHHDTNMTVILDRLREADVKMLFFTGGEPLLRKDIFELIEYARTCKMKTCVVTNGTLLTEEKAQMLHHLNTSVQVSLHGTEKTHDVLAGVPGAYRKAVKGLQELAEHRVPTNINLALTRLNFKELSHVDEVAQSLKASLSMTRLVLTGRCADRTLQFNSQNISELMDFLLHCDVKRASIQSPFPLCCLGDEGIPSMLEIYQKFDVVGCQGGITWCAVSPQGTVRTCGAMGKEEGDLKKVSLRTIWSTSDFIWKCRTFSHVPQQCCDCGYLSLCTGGCRADAYAASGRTGDPDPLSSW
ncbi:MAG: radical SAM protein [Theionarchaea archaeon]|nr:radical SAM protein [Theionarchaea archaeon]MBU7038121.1 radical SAM protein [Theionarchaea archaeon]